MLQVQFAGWFQCRLATDPDPTDEPRGVSGFTFALAGEPDFDRIIRFHHPVAPRSHGPPVGVFVSTIVVAGQQAAHHPLLGARVELLGAPKFESRNYIAADGSMGPIEPFHLQISGHGVTLRRQDVLYPAHPSLPLHHIPRPLLARRGSLGPMAVDRLRIAEATGITDPIAYRKQRQALLQADLATTDEAVRQAALETRIRELDITDARKLQVATLSFVNTYRFAINGGAECLDPQQQLGGNIDATQEWPIEFWMGGWDTDALCGYTSGMLTIPFVHSC